MATSIETRRKLFTVKEFDRMGEAGVFAPDERVELIQGEVRSMSPIGLAHAAIVNRLTALLVRLVGDRALVSVQNPVYLSVDTQPQPDVVLFVPRADYYASARGRPEDVLLIVEVADTTLESDRDEKVPLYARAGIPEVWLVDVQHQVVHQFTKPAASAYAHQRTLARGETLLCQTLLCQTLPGLALAVADILG